MYRILDVLSERKLLASIILIIYYLSVVLPHEIIGKAIAINIVKPIGKQTYNWIVLIIGGIILGLSIKTIFHQIERHSRATKNMILAYSIGVILLIIISINMIMVVNIELIHILQYAIFAIIFFCISGSYKVSLLVSTLAGTLDEFYQYLVLTPTSKYFDFNDVVIDLIGSTAGLIMVWAYNSRNQFLVSRKTEIKVLITIVAFTIMFITFLFLSEMMSVYPNDNIPVNLIREVNTDFWSYFPPKRRPHNIKFHVIQPIEGIIIIVSLLLLFSGIGKNNIDQEFKQNF